MQPVLYLVNPVAQLSDRVLTSFRTADAVAGSSPVGLREVPMTLVNILLTSLVHSAGREKLVTRASYREKLVSQD